MARPTKPKDVKPKALEPVHDAPGGSKDNASGMNMIMMAVIIILCTTVSTAASMYFLAPILLSSVVVQGAGGEQGGEEGEGHSAPTVGPVLDLEEFTVNLKDAGGQHYLRADFSLSVTTDNPDFENLEGEALHKFEENFHMQMGHYVPAIRDIIIAALTKRTSTELSSAMGKEELKAEIKRNTDSLFHGKHKVIRVNIENFIIQ